MIEQPRQPVVVLERIEPGKPKPDYCVHGRATCIACDEWVWLGHRTYEPVASGEVLPICLQCATEHLSPEGLCGNISDSEGHP